MTAGEPTAGPLDIFFQEVDHFFFQTSTKAKQNIFFYFDHSHCSEAVSQKNLMHFGHFYEGKNVRDRLHRADGENWRTLRAPRPIAESGRLPRDNKATGLGILSLTETRHIQGRASYMTHFSFSKFLLYKAAPTGKASGGS